MQYQLVTKKTGNHGLSANLRRFELTSVDKRVNTPLIGASSSIAPGSSTKVHLTPISNGQSKGPSEELSSANLAARPSKP